MGGIFTANMMFAAVPAVALIGSAGRDVAQAGLWPERAGHALRDHDGGVSR